MLAISAASSVTASSPRAARARCWAASVMMSTPRSVPATEKRPPSKAMSASAASSASEAAFLPRAITASDVTRIACPSE